MTRSQLDYGKYRFGSLESTNIGIASSLMMEIILFALWFEIRDMEIVVLQA